MYTANTMASAIEALGMSLPYSSSTPAEDPMKLVECRLAGRWVGGGVLVVVGGGGGGELKASSALVRGLPATLHAQLGSYSLMCAPTPLSQQVLAGGHAFDVPSPSLCF